jgi:hypothetical protein
VNVVETGLSADRLDPAVGGAWDRVVARTVHAAQVGIVDEGSFGLGGPF